MGMKEYDPMSEQKERTCQNGISSKCQTCAWFIRIQREGLTHEACAVVHIVEILNLICMEMRGTDENTSKASIMIRQKEKTIDQIKRNLNNP